MAGDAPPSDLMVPLFESVAAAAVAAQAKLDRNLNPACLQLCPTPGQRMFYSLPRAQVDLTFGLQIVSKKKLLFIPRGKSRENLDHRLRFELVGVPEPPPAPVAGGEVILAEPNVFVPAVEAEALRQRLAVWLRDPESLSFGGLDGDFDREADEVDMTPLLVFRLAAGRYLAVRVAGKASKDGLFLIEPEAARPVTVYTLPGDGVKTVGYEPLHLLALAMRRWLSGRAAIQRSEWTDMRLVPDLDRFVANLRHGIRRGLSTLAESTPPPAGPLPSHFDLVGVEANLSFSVDFTKGKVGFQRRSDDDAPTASGEEPPANRVAIRTGRRAGRIDVEIELLETEFVLARGARGALLKQLEDLRDAIIEELAGLAKKKKQSFDRATYERLLDSRAQREVVVFRSYEKKGSHEDLLVVWPAGDGRDFVFACERRGQTIERDSIKAVMTLAEQLSEVSISTADGERGQAQGALGKRQYNAFHRFFVALLAWRGRGVEVGP